MGSFWSLSTAIEVKGSRAMHHTRVHPSAADSESSMRSSRCYAMTYWLIEKEYIGDSSGQYKANTTLERLEDIQTQIPVTSAS